MSKYESKAKVVASRICGQGECMSGFPCGHANKAAFTAPTIGKGKECPLAKYNAPLDARPWHERLDEPRITLHDLAVVCACCEHAMLITEDGEEYVQVKNEQHYLDYCLDCPVQFVKECIEEGEAEAWMS